MMHLGTLGSICCAMVLSSIVESNLKVVNFLTLEGW
jgi:hypothetical protein